MECHVLKSLIINMIIFLAGSDQRPACKTHIRGSVTRCSAFRDGTKGIEMVVRAGYLAKEGFIASLLSKHLSGAD